MSKKTEKIELLEKIRHLVDKGISEREACKNVALQLNMNPSTVYSRWRYNKGPKDREHTLMMLTDLEELELLGVVEAMSLTHNPMSKKDVISLVRKVKKLDENWDGRGWFARFLGRHKNCIMPKKVKSLKGKRVTESTLEDCTLFVQKFPLYLKQNRLSWNAVCNADETILNLTKGTFQQTYIESTSKKRPSKHSIAKGNVLTMITFICTSGRVIMSVYILSSQKHDNSVEMVLSKLDRGNRGTWNRYYAFTDTGMMNTLLWKEIMFMFATEVSRQTPGLHYTVLQDRLGCHTDAVTIWKLKQKGVHVFLLPANTSHFLQPLDSFPFANFKREVNLASQEKFTLTVRNNISMHQLLLEIAPIAEKKAFTSNCIMAAFKNTGIFPFNENIILENAKKNIGIKTSSDEPQAKFTEAMIALLKEDVISNKSKKLKAKPSKNKLFTADEIYEDFLQREEAKKNEEEARKKRKEEKIEMKLQKQNEIEEKKEKKRKQVLENEEKQAEKKRRQEENKCKSCHAAYKGGKKWMECDYCHKVWVCSTCWKHSMYLQRHEEECRGLDSIESN